MPSRVVGFGIQRDIGVKPELSNDAGTAGFLCIALE